MAQSEVMARIEKWGKSKKLSGQKRIVKALLAAFGGPPSIAKGLKLSPGSVPTLRTILKSSGLYKTFNLANRVKELGFATPKDFFVANAMKTYGTMAKMLGCTWMGVQKQYERVFKSELEGAANGGK